jgi:hypothetical protein
MPTPVQYREEDRVRAATSRVAALQRHDRPEKPEALAEARNDLLAARLERAIFEALNPPVPYAPLSNPERVRLMRLLKP